MDIEMSIGNDLGQLKLSLSEFTTVMKHLSGEAQQQEVRRTLKEMIQEVRKSYDVAVDVFAPLYRLDSEQKFQAEFSQIRSTFKATYLKDINTVRTHCSIVEQKLEELKKRKGWMKNLPFVKKSFKRLEDLSEDWVANDTWLALNMESFLSNMNKFLNSVNRLQKKDNSQAYQYLTLFLEQFEDDFLALNKRVSELAILSDRL